MDAPHHADHRPHPTPQFSILSAGTRDTFAPGRTSLCYPGKLVNTRGIEMQGDEARRGDGAPLGEPPIQRDASVNSDATGEGALTREIHLTGATHPLSFDDFRALFASSPTAVALFHFAAPIDCRLPRQLIIARLFETESRCIEANASFGRAFGGSVKRIPIGRSLGDLLPPTPETRALFERWIDHGFQLAHSPANPVFVERGPVTYEFSLYPVIEHNRLQKLWVLFRDVSDLQRALDAARRAEAHYRTLVERPGLVLVRSRPDNTYDYLSPHIEDIIGYTPDDFRKNPGLMEKLLHPDDVARHTAIYEARLSRSREPVEVEFRVRRKDGAYQWFFERQTPLIGPDGEVAYYDSVAIDITERKHLEAQLLHSQRLDVMGQLASGIAHDFNNHLTALIGQIRLALHSIDSAHPAHEELVAAENAALGCTEMTRGLLSFGRKAEGQVVRLDLGETIDGTLQMLRHFLPATVELERDIDRTCGAVRGTPSHIQQVVMNLGINARDAMPNGGTLAVRAGRVTLPRAIGVQYPSLEPGEYVEISVSDTGTGMPASIVAHIFEPFFTTKPGGAGTGLGLSMVRSIVEAHGGAIAVETEPGRGTTMSFVLPRDGEVDIPREAAPAVRAKAKTDREFILVAEDDSMVLSVASTALDLHGYSVLQASDGDSAIDLFTQHADKIALAFVDQTMPRRSGLEVVETLRKNRPRLPIIFTSGHGKTGAITQLAEDSATVFIGKPYSLVELIRLIRSLIDSNPSNRADPHAS